VSIFFRVMSTSCFFLMAFVTLASAEPKQAQPEPLATPVSKTTGTVIPLVPLTTAGSATSATASLTAHTMATLPRIEPEAPGTNVTMYDLRSGKHNSTFDGLIPFGFGPIIPIFPDITGAIVYENNITIASEGNGPIVLEGNNPIQPESNITVFPYFENSSFFPASNSTGFPEEDNATIPTNVSTTPGTEIVTVTVPTTNGSLVVVVALNSSTYAGARDNVALPPRGSAGYPNTGSSGNSGARTNIALPPRRHGFNPQSAEDAPQSVEGSSHTLKARTMQTTQTDGPRSVHATTRPSRAAAGNHEQGFAHRLRGKDQKDDETFSVSR